MSKSRFVFSMLLASWVLAQQPVKCPGPLAEGQVMELIRGGVPEGRIRQFLAQCRVSFPWSSDVERCLREAGATETVLTELRRAAQKGPHETEPLKLSGAPMRFIWLPPGELLMGSRSREADSDEKPVHRVRITRPFEIGKYEVTQGQWEAVMGSNPSKFKGADRPVERVRWSDAQKFLGRLNARGDGYLYRLPTEAEWEYAARAGSQGDRYGNVGDMGWHRDNSGKQTHPVGQKQPNGWGLHDMLGNVREWCQDWYGNYPSAPQTDPAGPSSGQYRVLRGGSWYGYAGDLRAPFRDRLGPGVRTYTVGLRCVREQE